MVNKRTKRMILLLKKPIKHLRRRLKISIHGCLFVKLIVISINKNLEKNKKNAKTDFKKMLPAVG